MKVLFWIVVGFVGVIVLGSMMSDPSSTSAPHSQTGCSASKRAIEARLRSPGSAKWVDCNSTTAAGVQTVTLTVDSQNAFGALIRSQWVTRVRDNNVESVTQLR